MKEETREEEERFNTHWRIKESFSKKKILAVGEEEIKKRIVVAEEEVSE